MKKKMEELLCVGDFDDSKINPNWSPLDCLLEVARVAQQKMMMMHNQLSTSSSSFNNGNGNGKLVVNLKRKRPRPVEGGKHDDDDELNIQVIKRSKQDQMMMISPPPPPVLVCSSSPKAKAKAKAKAPKPPLPLPPVAVNVPVQELRQDFQRYIIERMGGRDWALVIEKTLFKADVRRRDSRLSIPLSQIQTPHFLTQREFGNLKAKRPFEVRFLDPSLNEGSITINRWSYSGKCSSYVLTGTWNNVVANNGLKVGDTVQLWSFRVDSALCFALVRLPA